MSDKAKEIVERISFFREHKDVPLPFFAATTAAEILDEYGAYLPSTREILGEFGAYIPGNSRQYAFLALYTSLVLIGAVTPNDPTHNNAWVWSSINAMSHAFTYSRLMLEPQPRHIVHPAPAPHAQPRLAIPDPMGESSKVFCPR